MAYAPGFPDDKREHTFTVLINEFNVPPSGFKVAACMIKLIQLQVNPFFQLLDLMDTTS